LSKPESYARNISAKPAGNHLSDLALKPKTITNQPISTNEHPIPLRQDRLAARIIESVKA
jgi:hypothetical protein